VKIRVKRSDAHVTRVPEYELLVDFVGENVEPAAAHHLPEPHELFPRIDGARWIVGAVQDEELGPGGDRPLELLRADLHASVPGRNEDRLAPREPNQLGERDPVR